MNRAGYSLAMIPDNDAMEIMIHHTLQPLVSVCYHISG